HRKPEGDEIYYPTSAAGLLSLLARFDYDIVHYHFGGMLTRRVLALATACTLRPGIKSVLTFHSGGFPSTPQGKATSPNSIAAFVLRRLDGVIVVNQEIAGFLEKLQVQPRRVRLISPYSAMCDLRTGSLPPELKTFFDTHNPVIISAGQLEPEYDLPLQIEALGRVLPKFPDAGLLLLGSGGIERDLRVKIESLHLAAHALLAGDVPHEATLEAISRADLLLRTALYDGDSISVREALHVGTPVIASDNAMRPEGVTLFPQSGLRALVDAIETQLSRSKPQPTHVPADETSLQAVLDFYQELLAAK
ncbi:MAG: glycosyltransferase, partial [Candidatus Sulfotelmatobacter sp.]